MQRRRIVKKLIPVEGNKYEQNNLVLLKYFKINKEEIIQKERLVKLAKKYQLEYVDYHKYFSSSYFSSKKFLFHLGDEPFDLKKLFKINKDFERIYTVNCEINDRRIYPIPLGLTDTSWCALIGDLDIIEEFNQKEKNYINLAYINFNTERKDKGLKDRLLIKKLFAEEKWVTDGVFERNEKGHRNFIHNIYNHKFVFCPRGNGVDTHRLWMSLYLRTIPIVIKHPVNKCFRHLPILFIDYWDEINEEFLLKKWEEMSIKKYDFNILKMSYWDSKF